MRKTLRCLKVLLNMENDKSNTANIKFVIIRNVTATYTTYYSAYDSNGLLKIFCCPYAKMCFRLEFWLVKYWKCTVVSMLEFRVQHVCTRVFNQLPVIVGGTIARYRWRCDIPSTDNLMFEVFDVSFNHPLHKFPSGKSIYNEFCCFWVVIPMFVGTEAPAIAIKILSKAITFYHASAENWQLYLWPFTVNSASCLLTLFTYFLRFSIYAQ